MSYLLVATGGALGTVLRYWFSSVLSDWLGPAFPWGTLFINISGSFVIGLFATLTGHDGPWMVPGEWRQFVMVGICGGYTTFSAFSLQTLNLAQGGEWLWAGANVVASVVLCLVAVWLGHMGALLLRALLI